MPRIYFWRDLGAESVVFILFTHYKYLAELSTRVVRNQREVVRLVAMGNFADMCLQLADGCQQSK